MKKKVILNKTKKFFIVLTSVLGSFYLLYLLINILFIKDCHSENFGGENIRIINDISCIPIINLDNEKEYEVENYFYLGSQEHDDEYFIKLDEDDIVNVKKQILDLGGQIIDKKIRKEISLLNANAFSIKCDLEKNKCEQFNQWSGLKNYKIIDKDNLYIYLYIDPKYIFKTDFAGKKLVKYGGYILVVLDEDKKNLFIRESYE